MNSNPENKAENKAGLDDTIILHIKFSIITEIRLEKNFNIAKSPIPLGSMYAD